MVTVAGTLEHYRRYQGVFKDQLNTLEEHQSNSFEENEKITQNLLKEILRKASETVPFYQNHSVNNLLLTEFPVLDRKTVANSPEKFLSSEYEENKIMTLFTGGSTGTPVKVYLTKSIRQRTYAFWALFYKKMDFSIGEKKASFVGRLVQDPSDNSPPFWRYNLIDRQLIFSSYHLTPENLDLYVKKLNSFKPKIIEGYPNSMLRLAEYIASNNLQLTFKPNGISTSSENFTQAQRDLLERAFNSKVFDQYGSAESVVFASDCEYGVKHIAPEFGIIEVLKEDGSISREGEGEFLATTLINDVMPLIRYRIGDLGKIVRKTCKCGNESYVIEELSGKVGAVVVAGDRKVPTAAIAIAFEYVESIKNAQIIQDSPDKIDVNLSVKSSFKQKDEDFVLWELRKMLGKEIGISFNYKSEIKPMKNGKYQMIVQNYLKN